MEKQAAVRTKTKRPSIKGADVVVIGVGYVGLPLAILAAKKGFSVIGFDLNADRILSLKKKEANYITEAEQASLKKLSSLSFTDDEKALEGASSYIICVPTPVHEDHTPNLDPVRSATEVVAKHLRPDVLVVVESTISPATCERVVLPILEERSGLKGEEDFYLAHCPERINPGDERWTLQNIPRVLGGLGPKSTEKGLELYRDILNAEVKEMPSLKEAEAAKMIENAFRDINIAFVNELAMSFDRAGIDLVSVIEGAATKPFSFMPHFPGCGVGGHCISVDPYYLIRYGKENGFNHQFLATAREINNGMPGYTVDKLEAALKESKRELKGTKVGLLGLSYKRDVPDVRESPALEIRRELKERGAEVIVFDPYIPEESTAASLEEVLKNTDAIVIATDHKQFKNLSPKNFEESGVSVVVDGRNCLKKDDFKNSSVTYRGIGR